MQASFPGWISCQHSFQSLQNLLRSSLQLCHVEHLCGAALGDSNFLNHFRDHSVPADFVELVERSEDPGCVFLKSALLQQAVQHFAVVDTNRETLNADAFKQIVDHKQRFDVCRVAESTNGIEIALQKFPEPSSCRTFTPPDRPDVIAPKRHAQFLNVLSRKPGQRHRQIKPHCHFAIALIGETEDLLVRFFTALAEQHFRILKRRRIDRRVAIAAIHGPGDINQTFAGHHLIGKKVPKSTERLRLDAMRCFVGQVESQRNGDQQVGRRVLPDRRSGTLRFVAEDVHKAGHQLSTSRTTLPCTSVSRKSRPV